MNNVFKGKIEVYDALFKKEIILLNANISVSYCDKMERYIVFFRLSPKEYEHKVWDDLDAVEIKTDCNTN